MVKGGPSSRYDHVRSKCLLSDVLLSSTTCSEAPARLKKQLQTVLSLQEVIEQLNSQIEETSKLVQMFPVDQSTKNLLKTLCERHAGLVEAAEGLYSSLNVPDQFPNLEGVPFQFIHTLLMARDLKIVLRQRLVGRYFEISRIDQSTGGADAVLGMLNGLLIYLQGLPSVIRNKASPGSSSECSQTICDYIDFDSKVQHILCYPSAVSPSRMADPSPPPALNGSG